MEHLYAVIAYHSLAAHTLASSSHPSHHPLPSLLPEASLLQSYPLLIIHLQAIMPLHPPPSNHPLQTIFLQTQLISRRPSFGHCLWAQQAVGLLRTAACLPL